MRFIPNEYKSLVLVPMKKLAQTGTPLKAKEASAYRPILDAKPRAISKLHKFLLKFWWNPRVDNEGNEGRIRDNSSLQRYNQWVQTIANHCD
jgi:hypothetical protein